MTRLLLDRAERSSLWHSRCLAGWVTYRFPTRALLPAAVAACVALACGDVDRPRPVGGGGRAQVPPVIVEAGGRTNAGAAGQGGSTLANGGALDGLAGREGLAGGGIAATGGGDSLTAGTAANAAGTSTTGGTTAGTDSGI